MYHSSEHNERHYLLPEPTNVYQNTLQWGNLNLINMYHSIVNTVEGNICCRNLQMFAKIHGET